LGSAQRISIASFFGIAAESLFATIFPGDCRFCNSPLVRFSRIPVCDTCLQSIQALDDPVCYLCGLRLLRVQGDEGRCPMCSRLESPFSGAVAYGSYEGGLRDLIHLLKYERVRPAAGVLGRMLAEVVMPLVSRSDMKQTLVVPVPLHQGKQRQRGFNQAELIAGAMLKNLPAWPLKLHASGLQRRRATDSQTGLSRAQRRENLGGAFVAPFPSEIAGRDVLLVDDVYTTGTTVSECARVLRRAGAKQVWVATVARVLKGEAGFASPPNPQSAAQNASQSVRLARAALA
jgi:ComF family protein